MSSVIRLPIEISEEEKELLEAYLVKKVMALRKLKKMYDTMDMFVQSLSEEDKDLFEEFLK